MERVMILLAAAFAACLSATDISSAKSIQPPSAAPPFMRTYGSVQPPHGFIRFCESNPQQCAPARAIDARFDASPERLSELDEINRTVNESIVPETDMEIYGVTEYWALPKDRGDCEDFALLKQHLLLERGWPASALLMTVVRDEKGDGHAVLTARTVQGDYILDNKAEDVLLWNATPYRFIMRQSSIDPREWVSLSPAGDMPMPAIAGFRPGGR